MGTYANNEFQRKFATVSTVIISLASVIALTVGLFGI
jgi:hypothetical protein